MADDKPDVHEDETWRMYWHPLVPLGVLLPDSLVRPVERPIVWPVGMIPIKEDGQR